MRNPTGSMLLHYLCAALNIAVATWIRLLLDPVLGDQFPFVTLFFAVLLTAWHGGFGPALVAVVLGALVADYFLLPPRGSFVAKAWDQKVGMALYLSTSLGIALLGGAMRKAQRHARSAGEAQTARKRAEEALREMNAILRNFYDTAPLMMGVVEVLDDDILHLTDNGATASFFRLKPDALRNRLASQNGVLPAHIAAWIQYYRHSERANRPVRFEYPHQTTQGTHWLSAIVSCLGRGPDGRLRCSYVVEDVTERKQAEDALRESEERFRQLADAMPQIVWTARPDGAIDYLNRQWHEFTGLPATIGNAGWEQIVHADDYLLAKERWAVSVQTGDPFEMEVRLLDRRGQTYRWHLIRTLAVYKPLLSAPSGSAERGAVARWFGTSTDIHEQKHAAETARYLAEASATLAGVVDYESTLQKVVNLAVPYFADWSAVDLVNEEGTLRRLAVAHQDADKVRLINDLMREYPPDPDWSSSRYGVFRTGKATIFSDFTDDLFVRAARDERHLSLLRSLGLRSYICVPLVRSGNVLGVLLFATAESGRRYTDADLALATDLANRAAVAIENTQLYQALREADRRKDEFLATLAHELRNPLAPIHNSLQILKIPTLDAATAEGTRKMLERQVHHLVRLVDDLLDVSRVMRGKIDLRLERVELATVVARAVETVQSLIEARRHELTVRLPPESLLLHADPVRLTQIVANLLTNAAKYTGAKGRIGLTARREGGEAVLQVEDTGIGIAQDMLAKVFELFFQVDHTVTKSQGGLGIGLTLVKKLVEMHHGLVEARSAGLGQGSEFVVRLPLLAQEPRTAIPSSEGQVEAFDPPQAPTGSSDHRLLVVDDNQDAADSLALLLRLRGYEVQVAHDGPEALRLVTAYRPKLVFLDIGMPGMDGHEVARRLRQLPGLENVQLAALTGWGQQEDRRRTAEAGFDHHLVKPVDSAALANLLAGL